MKKKNNKIGLKQYLSKHKLGIFLYILVYVIASAGSIYATLLFANAIEYITLGVYKKAIIICLICMGIEVVKRTCWYLSGLIYHKVANAIMADLNYDLSKQAFKLNSKTFSDNSTGTFITRLIQDPETVVAKLSDMVDMITSVLSSLIMVIYIATLNYIIGLIILAVVVIGIIIEKKRGTVRRKNKQDRNRKRDKVNSLSTEIVRSEKDIKSLGLEDKLSEVSRDAFVSYKKSSARTEIIDMNFWALRNLLIKLVGIGILLLGIHFIDIGTITLASYMIIYSNNENLYDLIWGLGNIWGNIIDIKVSTERMFQLFDEKEFVTEKFGDVELEEIKGSIEFRKVKFTYVEYEEKEDLRKLTSKQHRELKKNPKERKIKSTNTIFNNLSFKVEPNTTVAFVGKSGSGKSTILNLMSKLYEVDDGAVMIDGVNINQLSKNTIRHAISLVNQFPYIFDMTIKENLLLAKKDATDEEIQNAVKRASLADFVNNLPQGLDTKVGESGIKLSGGQKQRLAIARALLRNSSIIIFDESTSSLDNFAQEDIRKSIDELKGKSTIVIVAHRLSTIRNVDKIFFLDNGNIIDVGTFEQLFENNVKFRNMFYAENI